MEKKGLCDTCVKDKDCFFQRRFPVIQCEEFDDTVGTEIKETELSAG